MKEVEAILDGKKIKIVVGFDEELDDKLTLEEIHDLEDTLDLSKVVNDLDNTMEIDVNE